jgi:selenium-binding protein 1
MLQNSLDGDRVYVSNSLYSTWDNQFYPDLRGWITKLDRQADGSYALDEDFFVDFCTTEIFQ